MRVGKEQKLQMLWQTHFEEYNKARKEAQDTLDELTPMFCFCGKIASGLHTSHCKKFQSKLNDLILSKCGHLLKL